VPFVPLLRHEFPVGLLPFYPVPHRYDFTCTGWAQHCIRHRCACRHCLHGLPFVAAIVAHHYPDWDYLLPATDFGLPHSTVYPVRYPFVACRSCISSSIYCPFCPLHARAVIPCYGCCIPTCRGFYHRFTFLTRWTLIVLPFYHCCTATAAAGALLPSHSCWWTFCGLPY